MAVLKEKNSGRLAQLLADYFKGIPKEGDVVEGKVLSVAKSEIRVDIGGVIIGVVRGRELLGSPYGELHVGDIVEATVLEEENENGEAELSFRAAGLSRAWADIAVLLSGGTITEAAIVEANKGGLLVRVGSLSGFLPVSQLSPEKYPRVPGGDKNKILEHLRTFVGKPMRVKIIDASRDDEKLIVSEKAVWEEEQRHVLDQYKVGTVIEGKVSALTSFGAFVEFGEGLEGLVHISEIAWQRIDHPKDVLSIGDMVHAQVIQIDGSKIFLSMKRLVDDPWKAVKERYHAGARVRGKVLKVNPFGLFVELDPEIHGLAHISELSDEPITDITAFAQPGDEREFEVVSVEPAAHRLGLRIAGVKPKPEEPEEQKESTKEKDAGGVDEPVAVQEPVAAEPDDQPKEQ